MNFTIRRETDGDAAFIDDLNARLIEVIVAPAHDGRQVEAFQQSFTKTRHDHTLGDQSTFVAVGVDGAPLGYVNVREGKDEIADEPCGYVALLAVTIEAEGRGIGQALVERAEEWSRAKGHRRLALDVFASNARGLDFYRKSGFAPETIRVVKTLA